MDSSRRRLALTRKPHETVVIGEGPGRVEVTVILIDRNKVRLCFEAQDTTRVLRKELLVESPT